MGDFVENVQDWSNDILGGMGDLVKNVKNWLSDILWGKSVDYFDTRFQ